MVSPLQHSSTTLAECKGCVFCFHLCVIVCYWSLSSLPYKGNHFYRFCIHPRGFQPSTMGYSCQDQSTVGCCPPIASSVFLVVSVPALFLVGWSWPVHVILWRDNTSVDVFHWVQKVFKRPYSVSYWIWFSPFYWSYDFCTRYQGICGNMSFPVSVSFFQCLMLWSTFQMHTWPGNA